MCLEMNFTFLQILSVEEGMAVYPSQAVLCHLLKRCTIGIKTKKKNTLGPLLDVSCYFGCKGVKAWLSIF